MLSCNNCVLKDDVLCILQKRQCAWRRHCGGGAVFSSPSFHPSLRQLYVASLGGRLLCLDPVSSHTEHARDIPQAGTLNKLLIDDLSFCPALLRSSLRTAARSCGRTASASRSSPHQTPPAASCSSAPWTETSAASAPQEKW